MCSKKNTLLIASFVVSRCAFDFRWVGAALLVANLLAASALAQEVKPPKLFEEDSTIELTLIAPWQELVRDEKYQGEYPAKLEYVDESGNQVSLDLSVERRGKTRQQVCKIPPIKLRFEKGAAKGTVFRGQGSLKMVTHCQAQTGYEQYYVLEMLAYKMYNLLTDYSFKVRPLTVTYVQVGTDTEESESRFSFLKRKTTEGPVFAFLIEDDGDVAKRHDLKKQKVERIPPTRLDAADAALYSLFQFMVANVDWSMTAGPDGCCHNSKLIGPKDATSEQKLFALPYDFDSAGLVDSEYASPPEQLPIRWVTQRLYRGFCLHNPELEEARQKFLAHEQEIYDLVANEERVGPSKKRKALGFLEDFFKIIKDDSDFEKHILQKCRG